MNCPICKTTLRSDPGNLVKCPQGHRFYVAWADLDSDVARKLVLAVDAPEGTKRNEEFSVPDDATF